MRHHCLLARLVVGVLLLFATTIHAETNLVVTGVDGELARNIELLVAQPPERKNLRQFRRYLDSLPEQAVSALSAYGYYAAEASVSVSEVARPEPNSVAGDVLDKISSAVTGGNNVASEADEADTTEDPDTTITQVSINVTLNDPVRITSLDLQINNDSDTSDDFVAVEAQVRESLAAGNIFISDEYESAKSSILNIAQELGYFDFDYTETQVRVSRRALSATIVIKANAGARFRFGEVLFKQRAFSETFMRRWLPYAPGDLYKASLVGDLTKNLQNSGYFASVRVRPAVDPRYGQTVPVVVDLTQLESNQVAVGIGYSTDTEFRTNLSWGKPLLNSNGHSAELSTQVSRDTQSVSFAYRIPRDKNPLFNYWGIEYGLKNDDLGDVDTFLSTLNFQRVKRTKRGWTESFFIRWERERFEIGDGGEDTTDLVLPGFSYSRSQSEGEPFPVRGNSISFQLMAGSEELLSSIDFVKAAARFRYLRAVSSRNTLISTVQLGGLRASDNDRVPGSQRFFAGGDRTVRGYAFEDISPRDDEGNAVGGRFLEVLNLEYNYRFADLWSAAAFVDTGRAFNDSNDRYSVGAGVGIRWQSPVGPFRIDLAAPIDDEERSGFRVHLSLGADL